jgi:hypothetical protein
MLSARRCCTLLLLSLIGCCALGGVLLTALHISGARRVTGPGGLLPATFKAARKWARRWRLPRRNVTALLWRALSRSLAANFSGGGDWLALELGASDGGESDGVDALVPDAVVDAELFEDGADERNPDGGGGGGIGDTAAAAALQVDGLSLGAVVDDSAAAEDEDEAAADGVAAAAAAAPLLPLPPPPPLADNDAMGGGGGGDDGSDDGDDDGDDDDDDDGGDGGRDEDEDVRVGMVDAVRAALFGPSAAADGGRGADDEDDGSVLLRRRRGFHVRAAPPHLSPRPLAGEELVSGAWLLQPPPPLQPPNATGGGGGGAEDGTAECITGLDGFSLCHYTLACFNVPRQWSFSSGAAAAAAPPPGGAPPPPPAAAAAAAAAGGRTITAYIVRRPGSTAPPLHAAAEGAAAGGAGAPAAARRGAGAKRPSRAQPAARRRRRRHRPATFDRFWLDSNSFSTLDPHRLGPIYVDGLVGNAREIPPSEAVSVGTGTAAAAGATGGGGGEGGGGMVGSHVGPVVWVDSLYVAAAPPPDDDPVYPADADWRTAATLTFPLLAAAYLNATLGLALPPLTHLLYLGGESTALSHAIREREQDWATTVRLRGRGQPPPSAPADSGALPARWDAAFLQGFARFVAGHHVGARHAAAAAAAGGGEAEVVVEEEEAEAEEPTAQLVGGERGALQPPPPAAAPPPAARLRVGGARRRRRRGAVEDGDDGSSRSPSLRTAAGDLTQAGFVVLGRHLGRRAAATTAGGAAGAQGAAGGLPESEDDRDSGGSRRGSKSRRGAGKRGPGGGDQPDGAPDDRAGGDAPADDVGDDASIVRLLLSPEDVSALASAAAAATRPGGGGGGGTARVCARRAVSLGHKPLLVGGTAEANAFRLAAGAHVLPSAQLEWPYPSAAERRGAPPLRLLLWDAAGRVENAQQVVDVARKYARAGGALAGVTHVTPAQAAAMSPATLAATFNAAHVLVALAGEGFVHALFLPPRSAIILVYPHQAWRPLHARVGTLAGHTVVPVFSRLRGSGLAYGSTGTFTPDECEALSYAAVADSPCASAYRHPARVVVPLASFESALLDALALAGRRRPQHEGSALDLLEGAPQAGMPIPPYFDARYGAAISRAFCEGGCAPLPVGGGGGGGIAPGPASAASDVLDAN